MSQPTEILKQQVFEVVSPVAQAFPIYHPDAADINEALDEESGYTASCAVRAYAAGLLLQEYFPNTILALVFTQNTANRA